MRKLVMLFVLLWMLAPVGTVAGSDNPVPAQVAPRVATVAEDVEIGIPTWRFKVRAFGSSGAYPDLGVYRRMGKRYDVGLGVSGQIASEGGDGDYERLYYNADQYRETRDSDRDRIDISIYGELRRWNQISERVSFYWGARFTTSYSHYDRDYTDD